MDRIETMRAFVAVATEGSFTAAAGKLSTSSQLVSKYVAQLEDHLGVRLFNRTTRKVNLTAEGEQCFQHAHHILESINSMEGHFGQLQSEAKGMLSISAPVSFSTLHLSSLICDFKKKHPMVGINLQLNDRKVDVVEEGFDIAMRIGHLKSSSLIAKKVAPIRLVLCASKQYLKDHGTPRHPGELIPEHYLQYSLMEYSQTESPLIQALKSARQKQGANVSTSGMFSTNNGEVLVAAAIAGEGYVLQPTFIAGQALKDGKLQVILPDYEPEPAGLYAVYPHRKLLTPKMKVYIDFISDYFGPTPYWDDFD